MKLGLGSSRAHVALGMIRLEDPSGEWTMKNHIFSEGAITRASLFRPDAGTETKITGEQGAPENATHLKMQVIVDRSQNDLRFRVCFGATLEENKKRNIPKTADSRLLAFSGVLRFRVCFGTCQEKRQFLKISALCLCLRLTRAGKKRLARNSSTRTYGKSLGQPSVRKISLAFAGTSKPSLRVIP